MRDVPIVAYVGYHITSMIEDWISEEINTACLCSRLNLATLLVSAGKVARIWLIIDQLTVTLEFGLAIAVLVEERNAKDTWLEWNEDQWIATMCASGLNFVAGCSYFVAFFVKAEAAPVAVVAGIVMTGTIIATGITNGAVFKMQMDDDKTKRMLMPSSVS